MSGDELFFFYETLKLNFFVLFLILVSFNFMRWTIYLLILFLPVADLRPVSWMTCWRTCRVAASSSCLGASRRSEDQPPLRPPLPLCRLVPLWTNRPSSATSCRWQTAAAAAAAPPTSTEPSLPSALQVRLQQCVCVRFDDFWLLKMFRNEQIFI